MRVLLVVVLVLVLGTGCCSAGDFDRFMAEGRAALEAKSYQTARQHFDRATREPHMLYDFLRSSPAKPCDEKVAMQAEALAMVAICDVWRDASPTVVRDDWSAVEDKDKTVAARMKKDFALAHYQKAASLVGGEAKGPGYRCTDYYKEALKLDPDLASRPDYGESHFKLALREFEAGKEDESIDTFRTAFELHPALRGRPDYPKALREREEQEAAVRRLLSGKTLTLESAATYTVRFDSTGAPVRPYLSCRYTDVRNREFTKNQVSFTIQGFSQARGALQVSAVLVPRDDLVVQLVIRGVYDFGKRAFSWRVGDRVVGGNRGLQEIRFKEAVGTLSP